MKRSDSPEMQEKFNGSLRHYHRAGAPAQRSWDDWVEGSAIERKSRLNWLKISGITIGLLALGGIITGLVIELS